MACTKAEEGSTRANVLPVVVSVGNSEVAFILASIIVTVASQGRLYLVSSRFEVWVRNSFNNTYLMMVMEIVTARYQRYSVLEVLLSTYKERVT